MIRNLLIAVVVALPTSIPAIAEGPSIKSSTAKMAAWNLAGFSPVPDDKLTEQAKVPANLDAEVVALVEVQPDAAAQSLVDKRNAN